MLIPWPYFYWLSVRARCSYHDPYFYWLYSKQDDSTFLAFNLFMKTWIIFLLAIIPPTWPTWHVDEQPSAWRMRFHDNEDFIFLRVSCQQMITDCNTRGVLGRIIDLHYNWSSINYNKLDCLIYGVNVHIIFVACCLVANMLPFGICHFCCGLPFGFCCQAFLSHSSL